MRLCWGERGRRERERERERVGALKSEAQMEGQAAFAVGQWYGEGHASVWRGEEKEKEREREKGGALNTKRRLGIFAVPETFPTTEQQIEIVVVVVVQPR